MRGKPIEIAELTAAAAEDQRDFDRRRHHFERLDRNSRGPAHPETEAVVGRTRVGRRGERP